MFIYLKINQFFIIKYYKKLKNFTLNKIFALNAITKRVKSEFFF